MPIQTEHVDSFEPSAFAQLPEATNVVTMTGQRLGSATGVYLRVEVPATAAEVRVAFNPVGVEEVRQTKELNRSVRLGFVPPVASTR